MLASRIVLTTATFDCNLPYDLSRGVFREYGAGVSHLSPCPFQVYKRV